MSAHVLLFAVVLLVAGCATAQQRDAGWPGGVPEKAHFERIYNSDENNQKLQNKDEYLKWVVRFYEGWALYPRGWKRTEAGLLEDVDDERYPILKAKLAYLGHLMSGEWAKDNSIRRIHSDMLMVWAEVMRQAKRGRTKERTIDQITRDVLGLLNGALGPHVIDHKRYRNLLARNAGPAPGRPDARSGG